MTRNYLAFDIEICREIPEGVTDWKTLRPLGISCAATLGEGELPYFWRRGQLTDRQPIGGAMEREGAQALVHALQGRVRAGFTILGWNSLSFDFDILAEESGMHDECAELALNHVDMMFDFFCRRGHVLGLDKAAKGMGLPGKTEGMHGDLVPAMWAAGRYEEVLDYVAQDVRTTLDLALAVEHSGELCWTSNSGRPNVCPVPGGWLTVREALALPEPGTSWMTDPWPRSHFTSWLGDRLPADIHAVSGITGAS